MKKISSLILLIIVSLFIVTGCDSQSNNKANNQVISNGEKVDTKTMKHKHCTRSADAGTNTDMVLEYDVYYTGEKLNLLINNDKPTIEFYKSLI